MSSIQRTYSLLLVLLFIALGALWHSSHKVSQSKDLTHRYREQVQKVMAIGELIYNHQKMIEAQNTVIDSEQRGNLEMSKILDLTRKHKLKTPATSKESLSIKRTYRERLVSLQLKDEKLEDVILFMIDIEALGNAVVTKIDIARNPKNRDVWNADIMVAQRIKKDDA